MKYKSFNYLYFLRHSWGFFTNFLETNPIARMLLITPTIYTHTPKGNKIHKKRGNQNGLVELQMGVFSFFSPKNMHDSWEDGEKSSYSSSQQR
jgi:hypothetical protein